MISTFQFMWGTVDSQTTILDLKQKIKAFMDDRGWNTKPETAKNISISIACEAAELLEIFNWKPESDLQVIVKEHMQDIKNESADVFFALLNFCNKLNVDLSDAVDEKLLSHSKKYPADIIYERTYVTDNETTVLGLKSKIKEFVNARNWDNDHGHSLKSICVSVVCEAAELMEIFGWKSDLEIPQTIKERLQDIRYEVADIAFALLSFCNELDIDLSSALEEKIKINALKYPVKNNEYKIR